MELLQEILGLTGHEVPELVQHPHLLDVNHMWHPSHDLEGQKEHSQVNV